jgi:hypothetical protein
MVTVARRAVAWMARRTPREGLVLIGVASGKHGAHISTPEVFCCLISSSILE